MQWNLYGHEWAAAILQKHIQNNTVRHAYLFSGAPGIGRRSLALKFAQAINCLQPPQSGMPCGECRICRQTAALQLPDMSILRVREDKQEIVVDQVRELQRSLSLTPYEAKFRIALLLNFQLANENTQNALLKTLEEAPEKVILLITVDAVENLLPTVSSRCEILRLRPMPVPEMIPLIQKDWALDPESAREIAHLSAGRYGLAHAYQQNPQSMEQLHDQITEAYALFGKSRVERFQVVERLGDARRRGDTRNKARQALQNWILLWRDVMICKSRSGVPLTFVEFAKKSEEVAEKMDFDQIREKVTGMEAALMQLNDNVNVRLLLENVVMNWPELEGS